MNKRLPRFGKVIAACMREILTQNDAATLAQLQRKAGKYTDAGIRVSFKLHDGSNLSSGDKRAADPGMIDRVRRIGISSIAEGSDAVWIDLLDFADPDYDYGDEFANAAAERYWEVCHEISEEACAKVR